MTEWRGRARSILGQGVERLRDGALQWVTRISREAAGSAQAQDPSAPSRNPRLQRALGWIRLGVGVGRSGARRVRGRLSRTVHWASARIPGALLTVMGRAPESGDAGDAHSPTIRATAAPHPVAEGSIRSGFFSGPGAARRPGRGDPSQLRAFGRDAWTLFALWEVRAKLRPGHLPNARLELRVRALGGGEVLRRHVEPHGSLYLEGLVPGATYLVELWWTDGVDEVPVGMPPASVTLAMGPPSPEEQGRAQTFGHGTADADAGAVQQVPGVPPPDSRPMSPSWMHPGAEHPWAGSAEFDAGSATSPAGTRSGSGSGFGSGAGRPATSPGSWRRGAASGSGWGGSRTSPGASWHQGEMGGGRGLSSPLGGWSGAAPSAPSAPSARQAAAAWTPSEVADLIRPGRPPQRRTAPSRTASSQGVVPAGPSAGPRADRARADSTTKASAPSEATGASSPAPAESRALRGKRGRAGRRRARREARAPQASGGGSPEMEASPSGEPPVRRGFFQDAAPRPGGRRNGR